MDPIDVEADILYLWRHFVSMSQRRQNGFTGPAPITSLEMRAWAELRGIHLATWEVEALDALEALYLQKD